MILSTRHRSSGNERRAIELYSSAFWRKMQEPGPALVSENRQTDGDSVRCAGAGSLGPRLSDFARATSTSVRAIAWSFIAKKGWALAP